MAPAYLISLFMPRSSEYGPRGVKKITLPSVSTKFKLTSMSRLQYMEQFEWQC